MKKNISITCRFIVARIFFSYLAESGLEVILIEEVYIYTILIQLCVSNYYKNNNIFTAKLFLLAASNEKLPTIFRFGPLVE
jgi:hypothetical protein